MSESSSGFTKQYRLSSHVSCCWGDATLEAATTLGNTLSAAGPMTLTGVVAPLQWHVQSLSSDWSLHEPPRLEHLYIDLLAPNLCACFWLQPHKRNISQFQLVTFMSAATLVERHSRDAQTFGMWEQPSEHNCCGECDPIACLRWHEENVYLVSKRMCHVQPKEERCSFQP